MKVEGGAAAPAAAADSKEAVKEAAAPAGAAVVKAAGAVPMDDDFRPSAAIVEVLMNFLIRVGLIACEHKDAAGLSEQCVRQLEAGLAVWPEANLKFHFLEKQLGA